MPATLAAPRSPSRAGRAPARAASRRSARRPARPAPPRIPEDFYSQAARALVADLLATRAEQWQMDSMPPVFYYGRESEPIWGEYALMRCSGTTIRITSREVLCECLCMDLERGLRLLIAAWTPEGQTIDGHSAEEWRAALSGVLWRVGQLYREFARRKGEDEARNVLWLAMQTLWR